MIERGRVTGLYLADAVNRWIDQQTRFSDKDREELRAIVKEFNKELVAGNPEGTATFNEIMEAAALPSGSLERVAALEAIRLKLKSEITELEAKSEVMKTEIADVIDAGQKKED